MPPVNAEDFQQRVLAQRAQQTSPSSKGNDHLKANKKRSKQNLTEHRNERNKLGQSEESVLSKVPDDMTSSDSEIESDHEAKPLELTECLFCPHESVDLNAKMKHMARSHSFFIPDVAYLSDMKGLMEYLGGKVGVDNLCIFCSKPDGGHQYLSVEATQQHMRDKSHCKMCYDDTNSDEYIDFYDYSKSYPDNADPDDEVPDIAISVSNNGFELVLPSGGTVGHRSLQLYYRQRVPVRRTQLRKKRNVQVDRLIAQYRGLGWHGDVTQMRREFVRGQMEKQRKTGKDRACLGVKANKLQRFFRPQVIF